MNRWRGGFTLIELIVVIAVSAILVTMAVANFAPLIERNRITAQANDLLALFNYARSEAIRLGRPVNVCRSDNPNAATPICGASDATWGTGALMQMADGSAVLRVLPALSSNTTLSASSGATVGFNAMGVVVAGAARTFTLSNSTGTETRLICLASSGRSRVITVSAGAPAVCS